MKKTVAFFLGILAAVSLFTSCEKDQQPMDCHPVFYAKVSGIVVNEQGEPIPSVGFWYNDTQWGDTFPFNNYEEFEKIHPSLYKNGIGIMTDEEGRFTFHVYELNYDSKPQEQYIIACFFDTDGDKNGTYEPLFIESDPIRVELTWTGEEWLGIGASTNLFEPVEIGTFVMHEKK